MAAVLVHIDLDADAAPHPSSLQALAAGRQLASSWGATLYAALIVCDDFDRGGADSTAQVMTTQKVPGIDRVESALGRAGADRVIVALTDTPVVPLWAMIGSPWQGIIEHLRPRIVMFGADAPSAVELAPRTAARIGARLFQRARTTDSEEVELRDREGATMRIGDSGAAVALVGHAPRMSERAQHVERSGNDDGGNVDIVVLALPGGADTRIEVTGAAAPEVAHASALVVLGDDVANNTKVIDGAKQLAALLGARLVGSAAVAHALDPSSVIDKTTPLAPELCITIGDAHVELAGSTSHIKIGGEAGKTVDGALPGLVDAGIAELVKALEEAAR